MTASTLSFNPPIRAAITNLVQSGDDAPPVGATVALIGLVVDLESGAGQAIIVNPAGQIEWRDPNDLELFIEF